MLNLNFSVNNTVILLAHYPMIKETAKWWLGKDQTLDRRGEFHPQDVLACVFPCVLPVCLCVRVLTLSHCVWPVVFLFSGKCSHKSLLLTVTTLLDVEKAHCEKLHLSKESVSSHRSWIIPLSWSVTNLSSKSTFSQDGFLQFRKNTSVLTHPKCIYLSKESPVILWWWSS